VVGGAVRNALMGVRVADVEFATTAAPRRVADLAEAAGIRSIPTGIDHGTVTLVVDGQGFEVTSLREDIATDGRHAVVRFGRDWAADARRRDFTVNALSVDSTGAVRDPVGGYPDVLARRIRFIGDPDRRIAEDRLRALRLFRFHAEYGEGPIDPPGLAAAMRARNNLRALSAERVGAEIRRIVAATRAVEVVTLMQEAGILPVVLHGVGYLVAFARAVQLGAPVPVRLAALGCRIDEDALRVTALLRLANGERDRIRAALAAAPSFMVVPDARTARRLLYALGAETFGDAVTLAFAWGGQDEAAYRDLAGLPARWRAPVFPLRGRDALETGLSGGAVGATLRAVEAWWIARDFAPDETALRARLRELATQAD
jgi:tRNA nucleotidyltransferase/poly(A) polymerase